MLGISLVILTAVFIGWTLYSVHTQYRDPLHPAIIFCVPLAGMYVFQPLWITYIDYREFLRFLNESEFAKVAAFNGLGVLALLLGVRGPGKSLQVPPLMDLSQDSKRMFRLSLVLGGIAVVSYLYTVLSVGGFKRAYSAGYGGGWSSSGYVREACWFAIPALTTLSLSRRKLRPGDYAIALIYAMPLLVHGFLGARRGPIAAGFITLFLSRAITTGVRPNPTKLIIGMGLLACLMLALIANRGSIRIGGDLKLERGLQSYATSSGSSNEYIYGGGILLASQMQDVHYYGGRYIAVTMVRPIPKQIFPDKYAFAAKYLGIPNLLEQGSNMGTGNLDFIRAVGWTPAHGAAPGLVADLFLEFSYGYVISLWLVGRGYWFAWHRHRHGNRFWTIAYIVMAALSIYLISQTLEAMLFRFLLTTGAVVLMWVVSEGKLPDLSWKLVRQRVLRVTGTR